MNITRTDKYQKPDLDIRGDLVVIDYIDEWRSHPDYGKWGAPTIYDALDQAKEKAKEFGEHEICLAIPELVIRLKPIPQYNPATQKYEDKVEEPTRLRKE
jgi:hypothetical protein